MDAQAVLSSPLSGLEFREKLRYGRKGVLPQGSDIIRLCLKTSGRLRAADYSAFRYWGSAGEVEKRDNDSDRGSNWVHHCI